MINRLPARFCLNYVTPSANEVANYLMDLDITKACGPDGIPARLLKECANELPRAHS